MKTKLLEIAPVLPSQDIKRDIAWYEKHVGFTTFHSDKMYALLGRENISIHLQWHADTKDDPLLGGSVIRIMVDDIQTIFKEFVERKTITPEKLNLKTGWNTNEFGFYDLNNNAVFFVEQL